MIPPAMETIHFVQIPAGRFLMGSDSGLDDEAPLELQARPDQGCERARLAKEVGDGLGIGVAGDDLVDHGAQADDTPAGGLALDLEGDDEVVLGTRGFGHGQLGERA